MAITVKHSKVSTIPDDADTSLVRPSDWNADHTLVGTVPIANGGTGASIANGAMANLMGFTSTVTASGTTTLTNTSSYYQLFTGTNAQTIVLPVTSTLQQGWTFHICNNSTGGLQIQSSGLNIIYTSVPSGTTVMVTCIATGGTGVADWEAGLTDFSTFTGSGAVVLASGPTLSATTTIAGINNNSTTTNVLLGGSQTTGVVTIGNTVGTSILTFGQSTVSQTTNIQAGATASGSTKTMNIGTGGLAGSTTNIAIGSTAGTSTTTINGAVGINGAITTVSASVASASTITPTTGNNQYNVTALAVPATIAIPTGTPTDGQKLTIRIEDNGTGRALTWTTSAGGYRVIGTTLPTTTVATKTVYVGCIYNSTDSFWDVVSVAQQA
jgi:intracellular sulfur oxidation DsrE/DsrF family protein